MDEDSPAGKRIPYERQWARDNKVKAIIAMTHPMAVIIFSLLSMILAMITLSGIPDPNLLVSLMLSMAAAQASIGVFNDVFDWQLDKECKPWRAIPAGTIRPRTAAVMASVLLSLGLLFAASISFVTMILLLAMTGIGILYSARLKRTAFSWLPYAIDYPSIPVWVMVALDRFVPSILIIYLLAFPFVITVHICNQLRDFEEDGIYGIRGLVQRLGWERATSVCFVLLLLSPLPFLAMVIISAQPFVLMVFLAISILHWCLTLPIFRKSLGPASFRTLFRRLQISGPLLLVTWYWVFINAQG
jgi:4-hydroxybenzoate polyprenyltransferase